MYFYTVGNMLGVDRIHKWATLLGLGVKTGIDLPNEVAGPRAVHRVEEAAHERRSGTPGETISVSIGQGQVSVTPISLAVDDGDAGQRRHPRRAAPGQGGRRRQGLEAGANAAAAVEGRR